MKILTLAFKHKNMNEQDFHTIQMMEKYGGSFVKTLAQLAQRADPNNLDKIKATWGGYWKEYSKMK